MSSTHPMTCAFRVVYGYTQSDEISLLLHPREEAFGRKLRKLLSIVAGGASGKLSLLLDGLACFDCRISQLPNAELVVDYFRSWAEDTHRNALNAHCQWTLIQQGHDSRQAAAMLAGMSVARKNELLFATASTTTTCRAGRSAALACTGSHTSAPLKTRGPGARRR